MSSIDLILTILPVSDEAVDDEVDGAVDGDQQVVGLGQGMVLVPEMLTMAILNQVLHNNTQDFYSNFIHALELK